MNEVIRQKILAIYGHVSGHQYL